MIRRIGDVRVFRWAGALSGSPGWIVLLALGWTVEAVDERYWSVLMSREEPATLPSAMENR